jgi:hypothetical protein
VNPGDFQKRQVSYLPFDQDRIFERTFFEKWTFFAAGLAGAGLQKSAAGLSGAEETSKKNGFFSKSKFSEPRGLPKKASFVFTI